MSVQCEVTAKQAAGAQMSVFERYLTVWVFLCIVVGIALGQLLPSVFQTIGRMEIAQRQQGARHKHRQVESRALPNQPRVHVAAMRAGRSARHFAVPRRDADYADHWPHGHSDASRHQCYSVLNRYDGEFDVIDAVPENAETGTDCHHALSGDIDALYEDGQDIPWLSALDVDWAGGRIDPPPINRLGRLTCRVHLTSKAVIGLKPDTAAATDCRSRRGRRRHHENGMLCRDKNHASPPELSE